MRSNGTASIVKSGKPATTWIVILVVVLWLVWTLPLAFESRTLFLRDVVTGALPLKFFGVDELKQGEVPVFNPRRALGQAHSGNPNALPFYPGNLLFLVLPTWSAFNLHYTLHLLMAWIAMMALCRKLGLSRDASLIGGITYAGSGWVMSCLSFYNILTVAAWWPLAMIGVMGRGRRSVALAGIAVGMGILGGEPISAAIGFVPLLWLAVENHGWRQGVGRLIIITVLGALIALPQLVATLRILDFTVRGGPGLPAIEPGIRAFHPVRFLELILPFPFGEPGDFGPGKYWQFRALPTVPYFYTLYFGIVGFWLALKGWYRSSGWLWLGLAGFAMGWIGGLWPGLFENVFSGFFRYSEKFLLWVALAAPVLAAFGFDRISRSSSPPKVTSIWLGGSALLTLAALLFFLGPGAVENAAQAAEGAEIEVARTLAGLEAHLDIWVIGLAIGGVLSILTALAIRRRYGAVLIGLQVIALAQLYPLAQTMPLRELIQPSPWMQYLSFDSSVHNTFFTMNAWQEPPPYELENLHERTLAPLRAAELDAAFGIAAGLSYPLSEDFEGLYSPLNAFLIQELAKSSWPQRVNWLRVLGVDYLIGSQDPDVEGLELVATEERNGAQSRLFRVEGTAPLAWWPEIVNAVRDPIEQFKIVSRTDSPTIESTVPFEFPHRAGARVEVLEHRSDRWKVEVEGEGGVVVLRRAFQPAMRATIEGENLTIMPANFCLLGIAVPPGRHVVTVEVARWPQTAAWLVSIVVLALVLVVGWRR